MRSVFFSDSGLRYGRSECADPTRAPIVRTLTGMPEKRGMKLIGSTGCAAEK